jgi:DNA-binding NtrC family response regulator
MKKKILVVDDDESSLENIGISLKSKNFEFDLTDSYNNSIKKLKANKYDILIADLKLQHKSGLDVINFAIKNKSAISTILITGFADEPSIVQALKMGVDDILKKPYDENELHSIINHLIKSQKLDEENQRLKEKLKKENEVLRKYVLNEDDKYKIIGEHPSIKNALKKCDRVAKHSLNCLIIGESGTGKELLARYIHRVGSRNKAPFITINCAELSPSLFESELFGFKKGSFTNALESKAGLFEVADGGIIFLDEITEISRELQAKLLRVVETKKIRRIGESKSVKVDVQIISATNRPLQEIEETKILRNDLFHRLSSVMIPLSPLHERENDINLLLEFYVNKFAQQFNVVPRPFPQKLLKKLESAKWNGNIRQLANFVKNWILFGEFSDEKEIERWFNNGHEELVRDGFIFKFNQGNISEIEDAKVWLAKKVLTQYDNNKAKAARHFGMTYPGFHKLLKNIQKREDEDSTKET